MGGTKHDGSKPKLTLVDPVFTEQMARILEQGEAKYGEGDWKKGLAYARLLDAARRHLAAIEQGEDVDQDSGVPHAVHVACSMMFLDFFQRNREDHLDDRRYAKGVSQMRSGSNAQEHCAEPNQEVRLDLQQVREHSSVKGDPQAQGAREIERLTERVVSWADRVFPNRTPHAALVKMVIEEIPELLKGGLDDPGEYADVLIMLVDLAHLQGFDIVEAAHRKMDLNERRSWKVDPQTGTMSHEEERQPEDGRWYTAHDLGWVDEDGVPYVEDDGTLEPWAQYVATDQDGLASQYERKPFPSFYAPCWLPEGKRQHYAPDHYAVPDTDWRKTLRRIKR